MTISNTPVSQSCVPRALNVKAPAGDCSLLDNALFSDPFPLTLRSSWERSIERGFGGREGGGGGDEQFVVSGCARFELTVHLAKWNWNVLVVYSCCPSATVAKSSNKFLFFPLLLCYVVHFAVVFFFLLFFCSLYKVNWLTDVGGAWLWHDTW